MKRLTRIIAFLVLLTLLFTLILSLSSCRIISFFRSAGSEEIFSKETLRQNMLAETDRDVDYVWQYLNRWNFPVFDKAKLKRMEKLFRDAYYKDIPSSYDLAVQVGTDFLDNSYDTVDLSNSQLVSDALLTAFVDSIGDRYAYYRTNIQYDDYKDEMSGTKPEFYGIGIEVPQPLISIGVPISAIVEDSPADLAGILPGDVITTVHGYELDGLVFDSAASLIEYPNIEEIPVTVNRNGKILEFTLIPDRSGALDSYYGIGATLDRPTVTEKLLISKVTRNAPAYKAGLLAGDYIMAIDGVSVHGLTLNAITEKIKGESGTTVTLTLTRGEETFDVQVKRGPVVTPTVDYWITDGIGYVEINSFKANTDEYFIEAVDYMKNNGAKAVVYDVRNNLGGYLESVVNMLDYIAPDGVNLVSFSNNYAKAEKANDNHSYCVPTVVICNESSASAAELFTVGMRDIGAMGYFPVTVVGKTTYGKFIMQNSYSFTDGSAVTLTVAYYYSPLGYEYNEVGITPDVQISGSNAQTDAAMEEAKKLIAN